MSSIRIKPKSSSGLILFIALLHQLNITFKNRQMSHIWCHQKKLFPLQRKQKQIISDVNHILDEDMNSTVHTIHHMYYLKMKK